LIKYQSEKGQSDVHRSPKGFGRDNTNLELSQTGDTGVRMGDQSREGVLGTAGATQQALYSTKVEEVPSEKGLPWDCQILWLRARDHNLVLS
jgi:hypothetical protein